MLWCSLLLPDLPLEVYARAWSDEEAARPFAVASGGSRPRIVAANDAAREAGVKRGQPVAAALALVPALALRDRDAEAEARSLEAIATFALSFTSAASLAPPRTVLAEIGGSLKLFGGLDRLVDGDMISTGSPGLAVVYVPNQRPSSWRNDPLGQHLGRSDLAGVESLMDALDEAYSSWMRDIRLGKARLLDNTVLLPGS